MPSVAIDRILKRGELSAVAEDRLGREQDSALAEEQRRSRGRLKLR